VAITHTSGDNRGEICEPDPVGVVSLVAPVAVRLASLCALAWKICFRFLEYHTHNRAAKRARSWWQGAFGCHQDGGGLS